VLLCGASGVPAAKVVILGAGIAGANACKVAVGIGARVSILDIVPERLSYLHDITQGHITTFMSNRMTVAEEIADADLVIGSVLIPGAHAPKLVSREMLKRMRPVQPSSTFRWIREGVLRRPVPRPTRTPPTSRRESFTIV